MTPISRRQWIKAAAFASVVPAIPLAPLASSLNAADEGTDPWHGLKVGVATYTLRDLPIEEAIKGVKRVGLKYVSIKNVKNHIDLSHPSEERKSRAQMFREAGLIPLSVGNVSMRTGEADIRKAFEYARDIGVPTIVCAPSLEAIPVLDKMVKEFDIKLAIHNHGPEDPVWPSPLDILKLVKNLDPRIGCCIDVGHTVRAGTDVVEAINAVGPRLFNMHIKDLSDFKAKESQVAVGRGQMPVREIFAALARINYKGFVDLEYEIHEDDPMPGVIESIAYMRGVLTGMGYHLNS